MSTNQLDDISLEAAVRAAERVALLTRDEPINDFGTESPELPWPTTTTWSDRTYNVTTTDRAELTRTLVDGAEAKGLLSAGYLEFRAGTVATMRDVPRSFGSDRERDDDGPEEHADGTMYYNSYTQAQCSMTVRHPKGTGSGWAGLSGYDWGQIDGPTLATRALEKCIASLDPVKIEPGRYTVILEPQAVCDLLEILMRAFSRWAAESGRGPFRYQFDQALYLWRTKLGLQIVDERITITHTPTDPLLGVLPMKGLEPISWIDHGVLKTLEYDRTWYALSNLNENDAAFHRSAFRVSGGETSMDEMIASTTRGLLITRVANLWTLDDASLLSTGVTRDGLWLIERGAVSKAVKNMRLTESPLFVLNQIEQLGPPVPVFRPSRDPNGAGSSSMGALTPAIVPALKVRDFSFTSLSDAV